MVRFTKLLTFLLFIAFTACSNTSPKDNNSSEQTVQHAETEQTKNESTPVAPEEALVEAEPEKNTEPREVSAPEPPKVKKVVEKTAPEPVEKEKAPKKVEPAPPTPSHEAWDVLLQKYVSTSGKVNYKGFLSSKDELESYLDFLANNPVVDAGASRAYKMAYWVNAYNAFTIKLILDNYPVSSIKDIHNGDPWNVQWIKLGSKTYSLNNIENDILRPKYKDARIHFAVNCAANSCPPLLHRAWSAGNLEKYLDRQAKAFINNPKYNKISADKVQISKIFDWYAGDFGNIIDYLNKYSDTKINADAEITYMEYDWGLND